MSQRNRRLMGWWFVLWGVLLLLVSNHVLLGWDNLWPLVLTASGVVLLRVFQSRLNFGVVFAASWAIMLGIFLTVFASGLAEWGRMGTMWPAIPMIIGASFIVAGATTPRGAAGVIIGAVVALSASGFLYEANVISARVAAPFLRFWPLVLVLAGFVLMKRESRQREPAPAADDPGTRTNPFDAGALSPDVEKEIIHRVRLARGSKGAAMALVRELKVRFERFGWVGIYRAHGATLTLDPSEYLGEAPEHRVIPFSEGVCGAAATARETIIVPDVCSDPRYLACSPAVKSEIVVPIFDHDDLIGVLDIDSDVPDAFSDDDRRFLEALVGRVSRLIREEPAAAA